MLTYKTGNIFESPCAVLVNPVNTRGVMGAGLALQFKRRYSEMFYHYQELCRHRILKAGQPYLFRGGFPNILLFPTKEDWRAPAKLEWIEQGLQFFVAHYQQWEVRSIAFPPLGCGLGKLRWEEVQPLMGRYLTDLPIRSDCDLPTVRVDVYHAR